jgi:S-layer homology domain.
MKAMKRLNIKWALPVIAAVLLGGGALVATGGLLPAAGAGGSEPAEAPAEAIRADADPAGLGALDEPARQDLPTTGADGLTRRPLTRGELAQMLAEAFNLEPSGVAPFTDVRGHEAEDAIAAVTAAGVMDGWFDGTFRPRQTVGRAELTVAVVRALGLGETAEAFPYEKPVFRDVPAHHHAYAAISMAHRLGLYPFHVSSFFAPDEPVQAAEAQHLIRTAAALERLSGPVAQVNAPARTVAVQEGERRTVSYTADETTLIVRNGAAASLAALQPGDQVQVYADASGRLLVALATGPEEPAVVSEAKRVLRELATPEQLSAIIARDWDRAAAELKVGLYNQLLEAGVTPEEAAALLEQDWAAVEEHGKERLTVILAERSELEPDLIRAVLDQDWETAMSYVEAEVLEYVLNTLLETGSAPAAAS